MHIVKLDDLKDRRGYCQLKEEALDRTMWRNRFGRGFGPVVWQITDEDDDVKLLYLLNRIIATILAPLIDGALLSFEYLYHNRILHLKLVTHLCIRTKCYCIAGQCKCKEGAVTYKVGRCSDRPQNRAPSRSHLHPQILTNLLPDLIRRLLNTALCQMDGSQSEETQKTLTNERPTWCHFLFYFTYYVLNVFRTLIYPSSGACDCVDELPHRSSCSQFFVCWSFWCGWFLVVFVLQAEASA